MIWYLARRLVATVVLLAVVAIVTYVLITLAPGDTALIIAGSAGGDAEYLARLRERLGLDRALPYQVWSYLVAVFQGDLGFSVIQGRPVWEVIFGRLPATLLLGGTSLVLASIGGVVLGVVAAARHGSRVDAAVSVGSLALYSLPVFWVAQLLIAFLAVRLGWLPAGGMTSVPSPDAPLAKLADLARHLVLPVAALSTLFLGLIMRTTRTAMIEVLGESYLRTAQALGVSERRRLFRHALPNALRPVLTVVTNEVATLLAGLILVETVFSWPGLGRLLLDSILTRDNPLLVGLLLFSALAASVTNLVADIGYSALDPRVRYR
ncbi:MAG: ABC transporter permease [Actinomycetota bacterium]|nr:ABC transporter permease [Actinomycetota bacterium]